MSLDDDAFFARVSATEITDEDLAARAADVYLAFACAVGLPQAHRLFEDQFLSQVPRYVERFRFAPHLLDEVRQRVRLKQLFGEQPGITRYRGRGPLGAWVRVTAVRVAFDVAAEAGPQVMVDRDVELMEIWQAFDDGPEARTIKETFRDTFTVALHESLAALSPRDKTLLRMHVLDGLSLDLIARIYRVHRATVARWLVAIRGRVFDDLKSRAAIRWGTSSADLRSLVKILRDEIHLSARRILGEA